MKYLKLSLHLIITLSLGFGLIMGIIYFLDKYTNHNKTGIVPSVATKNLNEAIRILTAKGFTVSVDSTYRDSLPPLYVIKQFPAPGEIVKIERAVQLIVNKGVPPVVEMPNLFGVKLSSAVQYLERSNLKMGDTIFKPDFAIGRILAQQINGIEIKPGSLLHYGTKINLVIGSGLGATIYNYPDFYGMTLKNAYALLDSLGLSKGALIIDAGTKDSLNAYVYKQIPEAIDQLSHEPNLVRQGNAIDLFVSTTLKPKDIDTTFNYVDSSAISEAKEFEAKAIKNRENEESMYQDVEVTDPVTGKKKKVKEKIKKRIERAPAHKPKKVKTATTSAPTHANTNANEY